MDIVLLMQIVSIFAACGIGFFTIKELFPKAKN